MTEAMARHPFQRLQNGAGQNKIDGSAAAAAREVRWHGSDYP